MKRFRIMSLAMVLVLVLSLSGVTAAQDPEFFTSFTATPSTAYVGDTFSFDLQGYFGGMSFAGIACLEVVVPVGWGVGPVLAGGGTMNPGLGATGPWVASFGPGIFATPQPPAGTGTACDAGVYVPFGGGTSWFIDISGTPSGFFFGNATFTMGPLTAAEVGANQTVSGAYDDSPFAPATTINIDTTVTVNAAATTRYVANTATQCLGNTPCDTGAGGLAAALADVNATTVVVLGVYNAAPGTVHTMSGGETLKGQGGASININGACQSAAAFLTVSNGGTIEDLTFDGACASGNPTAGIAVSTGGATTIQNATIQDFANVGVLVSAGGALTNDGVTYDNNGTGVSVTGGTATLTKDTFTDNTTGVAHSGGTVNIGTGPNTGSTFTDNTTGINSNGAGATIKDNTISGGTTGINLTGAAAAIYGNEATGASSYDINCNAGAGAAFSYFGGNFNASNINCSDPADQLGSPIFRWSEGNALDEVTLTGSGPIFNLGNNAPFGFPPPLGRSSYYYATTSAAGTVTVAGGGSVQFKMMMDGTGCNPMTTTCWESAGQSPPRAQTGAGYYFDGSQDPTAITLTGVSAVAGTSFLPVLVVGLALVVSLGAVIVVRKRR